MTGLRPDACHFPVLWLILFALAIPLDALTAANVSVELDKLSPDVLTAEQRAAAAGMIERDIARRVAEVNVRNPQQWSQITSREQWEKYRDERIAALRRSLGDYPASPTPLRARTTGSISGDGFTIENVVFESRQDQWVPGNLYRPLGPSKSMPGILIAHSHHGGKHDRELQDMGMTWARAGCLVLIIDQVGYGERRSHPFNRDEDYPKAYPRGRQDYFFRRDTGMQLQLLGDSLMGWMVWDLMRGVDLLLSQDGIDPKRIILLGAVAGGGDPAGVTAALDRRIACCVPFNFGGPQPETSYPLPQDAETSFNYLGGTYWDTTRGLRLGGRDDFLHWVIVSSIAPRRLIHAHEFAWDGDRDPVWNRYQKIWGGFYEARDNLGVAHGKGRLTQQPPEASHCSNIGKFHRRMIHPLLERWFDIKVTDEYSSPRNASELTCLTDAAKGELQLKNLLALMSRLGSDRVNAARKRLAAKSPAERREILRRDWSNLLGPVTLATPPVVKTSATDNDLAVGAKVQRIVLDVEAGIIVPLIVLTPDTLPNRAPVVVAVAESGKAGFLKERSTELEKLVRSGFIVALPDVRGTGESRADDTEISTHLQLFGETLLGQRVRDLRAVLAYLRQRSDIDLKRIALWGDAFVPPNTAGTNFNVPHRVDGWPRRPEPLGGLLALLGALLEDDIRAVYIAGGLANYHDVLTHFGVLIPHGSSVPGALTAGDLSDLAAGLVPMPLRIESPVDHLNRAVTVADMQRAYASCVEVYAANGQSLSFAEKRTSPAGWLVQIR